MKSVCAASAYDRDTHRMAKRGKDLNKLIEIVDLLAQGKDLPAKYKPHRLKGAWNPKWDCHIEPDWLLIYDVSASTVILYRTGTHSDLFG